MKLFYKWVKILLPCCPSPLHLTSPSPLHQSAPKETWYWKDYLTGHSWHKSPWTTWRFILYRKISNCKSYSRFTSIRFCWTTLYKFGNCCSEVIQSIIVFSRLNMDSLKILLTCWVETWVRRAGKSRSATALRWRPAQESVPDRRTVTWNKQRFETKAVLAWKTNPTQAIRI